MSKEWTYDLVSLVERNNKQVKDLLKGLQKLDLGFQGRKSSSNHVYIRHDTISDCTGLFSLTTSDQRAYPRQQRDIKHMIAKVYLAIETGTLPSKE